MTLTREIWRQRWLDSINELTSLKLQRNRWLDLSNTNPHWTFVEFMCSYFDDLLGDYGYQHYIDKNWVTKMEYDIIKDWHAGLEGYKPPNENDYNHSAILDDHEWIGW